MKPSRTLLLTLACALPLAPASAAQPRHRGHASHGRLAHRYAPPAYEAYGGYGAYPAYAGPAYAGPAYAGPAYGYRYGGGFNAGQAQVPPRGFYDGYYGPGATVLRRGVAAQYEPGATQELAPDAKQTASGGPVGGLPGRSGP